MAAHRQAFPTPRGDGKSDPKGGVARLPDVVARRLWCTHTKARRALSTLYHNRMIRVIAFSRLLGRKRRAGDARHRQAALTPTKRREKRPFGRPWAAIGRRRAALVMGPHHVEARS